MNCVNCTFPLPMPPATHCEHCGAPVVASLPRAPVSYPVAGGPILAPDQVPPSTYSPPSRVMPPPTPAYPSALSTPAYAAAPTLSTSWAAPSATSGATAPPVSAPHPAAAASSRRPAFTAVLLAFALICSGIAGGSLYALSQHSWPFSFPAAAPTHGPAPTRATNAAANYHFHDSLQSNANGWVNMPPSCYFGDGGYYVDNGSACPSPASAIGNGTVSVDITLLQSIHNDAVAGIMFRLSQDQNTYDKTYEIVIGSDGQWAVTKTVDGTTTDLVPLTTSPAIHQGLNVANTLSVRMSGAHFVFFVNGAQFGTVDDPSLAQGGFALVARQGAEAVFSNFDVQSAAT